MFEAYLKNEVASPLIEQDEPIVDETPASPFRNLNYADGIAALSPDNQPGFDSATASLIPSEDVQMKAAYAPVQTQPSRSGDARIARQIRTLEQKADNPDLSHEALQDLYARIDRLRTLYMRTGQSSEKERKAMKARQKRQEERTDRARREKKRRLRRRRKYWKIYAMQRRLKSEVGQDFESPLFQPLNKMGADLKALRPRLKHLSHKDVDRQLSVLFKHLKAIQGSQYIKKVRKLKKRIKKKKAQVIKTWNHFIRYARYAAEYGSRRYEEYKQESWANDILKIVIHAAAALARLSTTELKMRSTRRHILRREFDRMAESKAAKLRGLTKEHKVLVEELRNLGAKQW